MCARLTRREAPPIAAFAGRAWFARWNLPDRSAFLCCWFDWRKIMDKEHVKGAADKAKGAMKDAAGKMTDDKKLQAEGKMDKAKGEAHQALGDAKDAVRRSSDK